MYIIKLKTSRQLSIYNYSTFIFQKNLVVWHIILFELLMLDNFSLLLLFFLIFKFYLFSLQTWIMIYDVVSIILLFDEITNKILKIKRNI